MYCAWIEEGDGWWYKTTELDDLLSSTGRTIVYETWHDYNQGEIADDLEAASGMHLPGDQSYNGWTVSRNEYVKRQARVQLFDDLVFLHNGKEFNAHIQTHGSARIMPGGSYINCRHVFGRVDGKRQWIVYLAAANDVVAVGHKLKDDCLEIPETGVVFEYRPGLLAPLLAAKAAASRKRSETYRKKNPPKVTVLATTDVINTLVWSLYDDKQAYSFEWNSRSLWVVLMAHDAAKGRRATNKIIRDYAKLWAVCPDTAMSRMNNIPYHIRLRIEDRLRPLVQAGKIPVRK